jgi:hypothetical protein
MNEHAKNLRRTRADMLGTEDNDHYLECQRAAAYIEQLEGYFSETLQVLGSVVHKGEYRATALEDKDES